MVSVIYCVIIIHFKDYTMVYLIVACIIISIIVGYVTRHNIGIFAMIFAYIVGVFVMELDPKKVIAFWPISIFFVIFSVSLFYNFASVNGTLEKIAGYLMYRFQHYPFLLPYVIFGVSAFIAALGAGFYSVLAFMAPVTFLLCEKINLDRMAGVMAINYGALGGANFVTSQSGIIFQGLMQKSGISQEQAFLDCFGIFLATIILPLFVLLFFILRDKTKTTNITLISKPQPFTTKQKMTLGLMLLMIVIILIFPILHLLFPQNYTISFINSKIDIGFIAIIFVAIALFLKLGDEKKVIALIPWNTLIMICGVGMLIGVATQAGVITLLADSVKNGISSSFIPLAICIIATIMGLFASTLGVVTPALFPIVPNLAQSSGLSEMLLFICIVVGAQASALSPFSSGGSLILGSCPEIHKNKLFKDLLIKAIPMGLVGALLTCFILKFFI